MADLHAWFNSNGVGCFCDCCCFSPFLSLLLLCWAATKIYRLPAPVFFFEPLTKLPLNSFTNETKTPVPRKEIQISPETLWFLINLLAPILELLMSSPTTTSCLSHLLPQAGLLGVLVLKCSLCSWRSHSVLYTCPLLSPLCPICLSTCLLAFLYPFPRSSFLSPPPINPFYTRSIT